MRRRFPVILTVLIGLGLISALFFGINMLGRNTRTPDPNGTGRNIVGENMRGANPNAGPNGGNLLGGNRDGGSGNNPPDAAGNGATPGAGNNVDMNKMQTPQMTGFDGQKGENIRNNMGNIDGASQINAVVSGSTALIGYNPTGTVRDANATKNAITERVKQIDNSITNVVVSDSGDITPRIGRLADNVRNNRAGAHLTNEFNQIMNTIRPAGQ